MNLVKDYNKIHKKGEIDEIIKDNDFDIGM